MLYILVGRICKHISKVKAEVGEMRRGESYIVTAMYNCPRTVVHCAHKLHKMEPIGCRRLLRIYKYKFKIFSLCLDV
jgi:hypothetical protein